MKNNIIEIKVPDDFENLSTFINIISKEVGTETCKFAQYDVFDMKPDLISDMFRIDSIISLYFELLNFLYSFNPRGIKFYIDKKNTKEKLYLFFKTILEEFPSEATIKALENKHLFTHNKFTHIVYNNPFGIEISDKFKSLVDLFEIAKAKSEEALQELDFNKSISFIYFENKDKIWGFKFKMKDLAQIAILYAKNNNLLIDADYSKKIYSLIPQYNTNKEYAYRSLYENINMFKKDLLGLDNSSLNETKALEEFDCIYKS